MLARLALSRTSRFALKATPLKISPISFIGALQPRFYASLSKDTVQERIIQVMKNFDKIDEKKVCLYFFSFNLLLTFKITPNAEFSKDLGLDSLDSVELVMAIEEEFNLEIPDEEADMIDSVDKAVEYITKSEHAV